jgi:ArsR family transcriptional regulator
MAAKKVNGKTNGNGKANREIYVKQACICKAFANPVRLELLDLLGSGERIVGDIQKELGISKANMSQHVNVLRSAGVITTRRDGKQFYCSLAIPEVKDACKLIRNVLRAQIDQIRKSVI